MNALRVLKYSGKAAYDGGRLWREATQSRLRQMLASQVSAGGRTTLEDWSDRKRRWKAFVDHGLACVREVPRPAIEPKSIREDAHDGFRVQRIVFDAVPGWTVGLSLFLPEGPGPYVPVLCPCGHGPKWLSDHQVPPQVLARNGFAAALFDMPMFGERSRGNDHFVQGPQSLMTGLPSLYYFLVDIVRVTDYLASRSDMSPGCGVGVTGVSGGGLATLYMPLVDPRVKAIAPVCCLTSLGAHLLEGLYTGCQENYLEGQAAQGFDLPHLLCVGSPTPCLVMGGTEDELFRRASVERAFAEVKAIYALEGVADNLKLHMEPCGHSYTAGMAAQAVRWFRRWLPSRAGDAVVDTVTPLDEKDLNCGTADATTSMLQETASRAARLRSTRRPRAANEDLVGLLRVTVPVSGVEVEQVTAPTAWGPRGLSRAILHADGDLPVPVVEWVTPSAPAGGVAAFGDAGTLDVLRQVGGLGAMRQRMVAADIRGYGELAPEASDYDLYSWCGVDRALGDLLLLLGDTALGQQTRDALRVLDYALSRGVAADELILYGRGGAALPALFAGIVHPQVKWIVTDSALCSLESLAAAEGPVWNRYHFLPRVLEAIDLPELLKARSDKEFLVIAPCDAMGRKVQGPDVLGLYGGPVPSHVQVRTSPHEPSAPALINVWQHQRLEPS